MPPKDVNYMLNDSLLYLILDAPDLVSYWSLTSCGDSKTIIDTISAEGVDITPFATFDGSGLSVYSSDP